MTADKLDLRKPYDRATRGIRRNFYALCRALTELHVARACGDPARVARAEKRYARLGANRRAMIDARTALLLRGA